MQLGSDKIEQRLARMEKEGGDVKVDGKEKGDSKEKEKEKESADDPQFVKDLLSLHDKFINVVNKEFCGNALFQKALKDAFVEVSGDNALYGRRVGKGMVGKGRVGKGRVGQTQ